MFKLSTDILGTLDPLQKRKVLLLQVLILIMTCFELIGLASILPFMTVVGNPDAIGSNIFLSEAYTFLNIKNHNDFIIYLGCGVLLALTISSIISMLTVWYSSILATQIGISISDRLYAQYLQQPYFFFLGRSQSELIKNITFEASRVTDFILIPILQVNAKLVLAIAIGISLLIYNPIITLSGLTIFLLSYIFLFKLIKPKLHRNSEKIYISQNHRFNLIEGSLNNIKEIILLNKSDYFIDKFHGTGKILSHAQGTNYAFGFTPRYLMELIAFGAMIIFIIFLVKTEQGNLQNILPILSLYALAGFKLLPAIQQVYWGVTTINGHISAFNIIKQDMLNVEKNTLADRPVQTTDLIAPKVGITLNDINFSFPNSGQHIFKNLNISILANQMTAIVGKSGAGKSTLIEIILGLLPVTSGKIFIDNQEITQENLAAWQSGIGYVPQQVFLINGTIAENVALGVDARSIDKERVKKCLAMAELIDFTYTLPHGIDTLIGSQHRLLSGGQKQRIGIARALYHDAQVLVFDEATSALDRETELQLLKTIHCFKGNRTVIYITHNSSNLQWTDNIVTL